MATDTDLRFAQPLGLPGDGGWYKVNSSQWYDCVVAESDSKRITHDQYNYGEEDSPSFYSISHSLPTYIVVNSVTLWYYHYRSNANGGYIKPYLGLSGANYIAGTSQSITAGAWTWTSESFSRPGGGSWARGDIANIYAYFRGGNAGADGRTVSVDGVLVRVNWDYITLQSLTASAVSTKTQTTATLPCSYNANGDGDTEWRIMYKASGGSYDDPSWTASSNTGSNSVSRNLTGLSAGTTYYFKLQARNSNNTVQESSEQSFTTDAGSAGVIMFF